jgi:hypothetical protein
MGFLEKIFGGHGRHGRGGHHGNPYRETRHDSPYSPTHGETSGVGAQTPPGSRAGAGLVVCPACQASNIGSARFCQQCGTPIAPRACTKCATALAPDAKFCAQCGQPAT